MSHKELDMATETVRETSPKISWMQRMLPHFFTPTIVANRELGESTLPPLAKPRKTQYPVTRSMGGQRTVHVLLRLNANDHTFTLRCERKDTDLPIDRDTLRDATAATHGKEWVRIVLGTEVYHLNRAELRAAFQKLDKLGS